MDHSQTVPQLANAPLNFFIKICQFLFLPIWNSLNHPPPRHFLYPYPSPIYYKNNNRPLAVIIQDYFKNHLQLRIAKTLPFIKQHTRLS